MPAKPWGGREMGKRQRVSVSNHSRPQKSWSPLPLGYYGLNGEGRKGQKQETITLGRDLAKVI